MNKQEELKELKKTYENHLVKLNCAEIIANKIDDLLPPDWESCYVQDWDGLLFRNSSMNENERPSMDFKLVCKLVEKATGKEVKKEPWVEGDLFFCLHGTTTVKINDLDLKIDIRMFDPANCKLEYEEKAVRIAKVDDACLGLGK